MPTLGRDRWKLLSRHLDEALKLSDAERSIWLEALGMEDAALAGDLEMLLAQQRVLADEQFLEERSVLLPGTGSLLDKLPGSTP